MAFKTALKSDLKGYLSEQKEKQKKTCVRKRESKEQPT